MADQAPTSLVRIFPVILSGVIGVAILIAWFGDDQQKKIDDQQDHPEWLQNLHRELKGKSHWERVVALRAHAHRTVDLGNAAFYMDFVTVDTMPLATLHEVFRNDLGAVMCGGKSMYLKKLYRAFDYRVWSYNMGEVSQEVGGASHIVNLVEVPMKDDTILSIQDGYLNHTYVDAKGQPIDIFEMLRLLNQQQADSISLQGASNPIKVNYLIGLQQDYTPLSDSELKKLLIAANPSKFIFSNHPAGLFVKELRVHSYKVFIRKIGDLYFNFLARKGYPRNFLYLFLFPKSVTGPEQEKMRGQIDSIINYTKSVK